MPVRSGSRAGTAPKAADGVLVRVDEEVGDRPLLVQGPLERPVAAPRRPRLDLNGYKLQGEQQQVAGLVLWVAEGRATALASLAGRLEAMARVLP